MIACSKQFTLVVEENTPLTLDVDWWWGIRRTPYFTYLAYDPAFPGSTLQLIAGGAIGSVTWEIVAGSLPTGMALTSAGVFSGTPTDEFDFPDTDFGGVPLPERRKLFPFTVKATDSTGHVGFFPISFRVIMGARYDISYILPVGAVRWDKLGRLVMPTPYHDVGILFDWDNATFDPLLFEAPISFPVRNGAGVWLSTYESVNAPEMANTSAEGFTSWLYLDGEWRTTVMLFVKWNIGPDEYLGSLAYDTPKGALYGTWTLPVSRWSILRNGIPSDPPDTSGSLTVTVS